jgi:GDP-L-fucose synthase
MIILVTGGTGLVGQAVKKHCVMSPQHKFIFLSSKDCDLRDYKQTYNLFEKYNPDIVIHLAGQVGGLYKNMKQKVQMLEDNLMMNHNVLKCCYLFNIIKCFCCLSTCIFPDKTDYPISEDMLHDGPPHPSNYSYAYAKRMMEIQCRSYNEQYFKNFVCVIPTNIYGEYDNFNLLNSHVIPGLIYQCYLAKKENRKFIVKGSGKPLRQFIYSQDLAKILIYMIDYYHSIDSMILSTSPEDEISIKDIAECVSDAFNMDKKIIHFDISYSDGQYKKTADNSKCLTFLKDINKWNTEFTFTPIKEGIKQTVEWFVSTIEDETKSKDVRI